MLLPGPQGCLRHSCPVTPVSPTGKERACRAAQEAPRRHLGSSPGPNTPLPELQVPAPFVGPSAPQKQPGKGTRPWGPRQGSVHRCTVTFQPSWEPGMRPSVGFGTSPVPTSDSIPRVLENFLPPLLLVGATSSEATGSEALCPHLLLKDPPPTPTQCSAVGLSRQGYGTCTLGWVCPGGVAGDGAQCWGGAWVPRSPEEACLSVCFWKSPQRKITVGAQAVSLSELSVTKGLDKAQCREGR